MLRPRSYAVAALAAVLALAAFQAGSSSHRALPDPTVAMINIARVINGLDEIKARESQLQTFVKTRQTKVDELTKQFDIAKSDFDLLPAGAQRREKAEVLERLRMQIRFESELAEALINARRGEIFAELFTKIDSSVSELAKSRGYTLVLTDDQDAGMPANPSEQQARATIYGRRVMYADNAVDITDELVQQMNNQWQTGQGN